MVNILAAPTLSPEEKRAVLAERETAAGRPALDVILEARINAALQRGAEAAARASQLESVPELPRILVVRGGSAAHRPRSRADVVQVLTDTCVFEPAEAGTADAPRISGESVLLTDESGFQELDGVLRGKEETDFLDESTVAGDWERTKQLTVVRSMHALGALTSIIENALPGDLLAGGDAPAPPHDLTGQVLSGKYRVKRLLGEGGFGSVYEAVDEMLGASVAIKVLTAKAARHQQALQRFLEEAKLLTNLDHPNIVRWITFDKTPDGLHYFVMEHLTGVELSEILWREGKLSPERTLSMLLQIVSALCAAHRLPDGTALYHLDLKPGNVFVLKGDPERVKVIDFGISQHVGAEAREASGIQVLSRADSRPADLSLTIASQITPPTKVAGKTSVRRARGGTLLYASPEQCKHLAGDPDIVELDGRSDLYSLGVMAFQMLTGELPFGPLTDPREAIDAHLRRPPHKLSEHGVRGPRGLATFVERCLAKDRDERWRDAEEARAFLDRVANPPARWPKVAAALALAAIPVLWWLWPNPPLEPFDVTNADGAIYLGPRERSARLEIAKLRDFGPDATVGFVDDPARGQPVLADWRATLEESGIRVEAPAELAGLLRQPVYLAVSGAGGSQYSRRLDVVYLGPDAWSLDHAGVPGLPDGGVLDPVGASLEIRLRARRDFIQEVSVSLAGETLNAEYDAVRSTDDVPVYALPLQSFEAIRANERGPVSLQVRVTDRAADVRTADLELQLDPIPLSVDAELRGCIRTGPRAFLVNPKSEPVLVIDTQPRGARKAWQVVDASGTRMEVGSEPAPDGALRLLFPALESSYEGTILISADDSADVLHVERERGEATVQLAFEYETQLPVLDVVLPGARRFEGRDGGLPTYYTNDPALRVSLSRNAVQVSVVSTCTGTTSDVSLEQKTDLHREGAADVVFRLPDDGGYRIDVAGFRHAGTGARTPEEPEAHESLLVVLDRTPPEVRLSGPEDLVILAGAEADWRVEVILADAVEDPTLATPAELAWEVRGPVARRGNLPTFAPGSPLAVDWTTLGIEPSELADGVYELRLQGRDTAGNAIRTADAAFTWEVARRGPELGFVQPSAAEWLSSGGNRFDVVITARDSNGVAGVTASVAAPDGSGSVEPIRLTPAGADLSSGEWKGSFHLPTIWSGTRLRLSCSAIDARGNATELPADVQVDAFETRRPDVIEVVRLVAGETIDLARMRFVEGDDHYLVGGRGDSTENTTFRDHGLPVFDEGEAEKSWAREVRIDPFYLDETEVTVGQFRAFSSATGGDSDLVDRLQGVADDLPVTGVTWHEASAYARWAGKRLPSFEEWEYAVRGGSEYRPFSCASIGASLPDPATFNVDVALSNEGSAWPVGRGADRTPKGILDLCSNVSEWTSTSPRPDHYFAVGANYSSIRYDFSRAFQRRPDARSPTIGFRCAMSLEDVLEALEGRRPGPTRIRDLGTAGGSR